MGRDIHIGMAAHGFIRPPGEGGEGGGSILRLDVGLGNVV